MQKKIYICIDYTAGKNGVLAPLDLTESLDPKDKDLPPPPPLTREIPEIRL